MKTKNKLIALLEIAIVLCSVFFVAIPAIATEQTTQTIITASEDDYVLGIYGNANEDDTIDMRDLTYVKLIFFGKKPETELADAKYDGKINPLDFIQIKLIIVGKEKELTIIDDADRIVTIPRPLERVVVMSGRESEAIRLLEEENKVVGVPNYFSKKGYAGIFPVIADKPSIGSLFNPDYEKIIELEPQVLFIIWPHKHRVPTFEEKVGPAGIVIAVIHLRLEEYETYDTGLRKIAWMFRKEERAEKIIKWRHKYLDLIEERVKGLKPEKKPTVYFEAWREWHTVAKGGSYHLAIVMAGGKNIFAELLVHYPDVDPEDVIKRNPEIIIRGDYSIDYTVTDDTAVKKVWEEIMGRDTLKEVKAVKEGKVYVLSSDLLYRKNTIGVFYLAKLFHPDLFEDLHPEEIHKEWFEWYRLPYKGIYVYPPLAS